MRRRMIRFLILILVSLAVPLVVIVPVDRPVRIPVADSRGGQYGDFIESSALGRSNGRHDCDRGGIDE